MHRTELGGHGEHLVAYVGAAFVLGIGARQRAYLPLLGLIAYAGLLEVLQMAAPGRTSQIGDFLYSVAGISLGIFAAKLLHAFRV